MDKKIGNLFLVVLFFLVSVVSARDSKINIELISKYHQTMDTAEVGVPFVLQVSCENFEPKSSLEGLASTDDATIQFAGSTQLIRQMNGQMQQEEYIFKYVVLAKNKGTLELGPITAQDKDGKTVSSKKIKIEVGDIAAVSYTGHEQYILDIEPQAEQIYVGQKLKLYVNFCYQAGFEDLAIENTLPDNVEMGYQDKNWKSIQKVIASQEYPCKQMSIEFFPKKIGTLIIPSFRASFIAEQRQDIGVLGFFGFANSKLLESHPKQITVLPLPESAEHKNVQAIGTFKSAKLLIDTKKGQIGEGIHVRMIVEGDGNLDIVHHPELVLPQGINFYEGNSTLDRIDDSNSKKTFDWILQSDVAGTFTIKPQIFVYFDPIHKKYKELRTNAAELIIEGSPLVEQPKTEDRTADQVVQSEEPKHDPVITDQQVIKQEQTRYYSSQNFYPHTESAVLTWWIIFLAILTIIVFLVLLLMPYFAKIFFIQTFKYRWLFWKYSRACDIPAVYKLFEQISHDYQFGLQSKELHDAFLKNNFSDESFENWKNFLNMLLEFNFAFDKSLQDNQLVLNLAKEWFSIILLCCKTLRRK